MMDDNFDIDEKKLYEELYSLMGAKIRFKCDGCLQEGEIVTIKPTAKRVTLKNVYFILPEKRVFSGTLKYRFNDLVNYDVVATAKELYPYPKHEYLENLLKDDSVGKKYSINDLFFGGYLSESDDEEGEKDVEDEFEFEVPKYLESKVPRDSVIIDCYDLEWKQALKHIGKQTTIGVSFHGHKVSRLGKLSWLCISTSYCLFLFDIEKLGVDVFKNGLKDILEDKAIKKVIHDSRFPSDCLAHQFDTKLDNVFDTLVADFVVSMQSYNDKYKYEYVQSLNSCLQIHLEIPPEFTYAQDRCIGKNGMADNLSKRPVNNAVRYILVKNTIYLLMLQEVLAKKLRGPLHRNVERYLRVLAGATEQELETVGDEISSPDCIPSSLLMYGIQTVQFKKLEKIKLISLKCEFQDPRTGKVIVAKRNSPFHHVDSNDSNNSNFKENISCQKKSNDHNDDVKENRQQTLPILKNNQGCLTESNHSKKKSIVVDKMIVGPTARYTDLIYHKLVNSRIHSQNIKSVINVKPIENYVSKFTMRMPVQCAAFDNSTTSNIVSSCVAVSPSTSKSSPAVASNDFSDYSDTWARLRAECNVSHNSYSKSSILKLVPAGMSC